MGMRYNIGMGSHSKPGTMGMMSWVRVDKMRMMNDKRMNTFDRKRSLFVWKSGSILRDCFKLC